MTIPSQVDELTGVMRDSRRLMACLRALHSLALPDAYIAAGAVRNTYWAYRHGRVLDDIAGDVDVVYFDPARPLGDDAQLERILARLLPGVPWDVTNQAHVHGWYEAYAGMPTRPLQSAADGISTFPELATCVGARLSAEGNIEVVAPHGLADLFALRWQANPQSAPGAFVRRLMQRDAPGDWPRVQVIHDPMTVNMSGIVNAVSRSPAHRFSKQNVVSIELVAGHGIAGDSHAGKTVQHLSRVAKDPLQPNLRHVHLIQGELHDELAVEGFTVKPGDMGENITTRNLDLLALPTGARLHLGGGAVVELTGLRNPCKQLNAFLPGLMRAVLDRDEHGDLVRKAGVMGIVIGSGVVRAGDSIRVELPPIPHRRLEPV